MSGDEEHKEVKIWPNVKHTSTKPCRSLSYGCCAWIAVIVVVAILSFAVGSVTFSLDVPFYDRGELNQKRQDAVLEAQRDADLLAEAGEVSSSTDCIHSDPTILYRNGTLGTGPAPSTNCQRASSQYLRVMYITKDRKSNIFTESNLEAIKKIEDRILNHLETTRYCYLQDNTFTPITSRSPGDDIETVEQQVQDSLQENATNRTSCKRISSALNFFDPWYFDYQDNTGLGTYLISPDVVQMQYNFSQENIDMVTKYWSNFTAASYDLTEFPLAVQTIGESISIPNIFYQVVSSDYGSGNDEAIGLISFYDLGIAVDGYPSSTEDTLDQYEDVGLWLWEEFNDFLKDADFDNVNVYFNDNEGGMENAELSELIFASFFLIIFSILFVYFYFMFMTDSIFLASFGLMQIFLSFVPGILIYRYILQIEYIGVLNLIAVYIILGIGVDDLFVFCDTWNNHADIPDRTQRYQHVYEVAVKAMFTTSCTTFISFISNAVSVFPAVSTFGLFSASLVLCNFCAIITFFPTVHATYTQYIQKGKWDHPSTYYKCCYGLVCSIVGKKSEKKDDEKEGAEKGLVRFFKNVWTPLVVKFRVLVYAIFLIFLVIMLSFGARLEPDEDAPNTLPTDNNYYVESNVLIKHFARTGNPTAITVQWVHGIDPDAIISRKGTDPTNTTDYGKTIYASCDQFDPTTKAAQVWQLRTCHDAFFGNETEYHNANDDNTVDEFGSDGTLGPGKDGRKVTDDVVVELTTSQYYTSVMCPTQIFRDWLLTDYGCEILTEYGLECYNVTSQRPDCVPRAVNNSCEPFPVPPEYYSLLLSAATFDERTNPATGKSNYDLLKDEILIDDPEEGDQVGQDEDDDYSCRSLYGNVTGLAQVLVVKGMLSEITLTQDIGQNFEDGIDLYEKWEAWSKAMVENAPDEMKATYQGSKIAWAFYFLNETLIQETFTSIGLALGLGFIVLTLVSGNAIMAFYCVFVIFLIVINVIGMTVVLGWSLGVIEAVNYVVVIGLSIDYCVHMSEAYTEAPATDKKGRVEFMMQHMAVSVLSGACSTLGCVFFMLFAPNTFFVKFATFVFLTILFSCIYALTLFPAILSLFGPEGDRGDVYVFGRSLWAKCFKNENMKVQDDDKAVQQQGNIQESEQLDQQPPVTVLRLSEI